MERAVRIAGIALSVVGLSIAGLWLSGPDSNEFAWLSSAPQPRPAAAPVTVSAESVSARATTGIGPTGEMAATSIAAPAAAQSETAPPEPPPDLNLLFFGDLMLDRHVRSLIEREGLDYILGGLYEDGLFDGHDLVSANLEGAVTDNGAHYPPQRLYDFAFEPETVRALADYGFGFFSLANNHLADQGTRGETETRANLDRLGYDHSGCRNGQVGDCNSTVVEIQGQAVGLAGFSLAGVSLDLDEAESRVADLKSWTDWVIVNVHWGQEYRVMFSSRQQQVGRRLIEAGADAVIGHHPHVVQGMETYQGKPIFYSLGNFVFDQYFSEETQQGLAVALTLSEDGISYSLYPFRGRHGRLHRLGGAEEQAFLKAFSERSAERSADR